MSPSIEEARAQLQQQKQATARARQDLAQVKKQVPQTTAETLRKKDTGLKGRQRRQQIQKVKSEIGQREEAISEYEKGLSSYEQEIQQTETQQKAQALYQQNINDAAQEYARKGGEAGGDVDYIRDKYGKDVYLQAKKLVDTQTNRAQSETASGFAKIQEIQPTTLPTITAGANIPNQFFKSSEDFKTTSALTPEEFSAAINELRESGYIQPSVGGWTGTDVSYPGMTGGEVFAQEYRDRIEPISVSKELIKAFNIKPKTTVAGLFISDVVASKEIIDTKAREYSRLTSDLNSQTQKELAETIREVRRIGGTVEETTNEKGETAYQFSEPTVRIGASKATSREVPVSQLSDQGIVRYSTGLFTGEVGKQYEVIASDTGTGFSKTIPFGVIKKEDLKQYELFGWKIPTDPIGKTTSQAVTNWGGTQDFFTPEQIGKGAEIFAGAVTFPVSYGGGLAESTFVGSEFGAPSDPWKYVKAHPVETAMVVGAGFLGAGLRGVKYFKGTPIVKYKKLAVKDVESFGIATKPKVRQDFVNVFGKEIQMQGRELSSVSGAGKTGYKAIVKTERLIAKELPFLKKVPGTKKLWEPKTIYEGVYNLDKLGYKKALKLLEKQGYTTRQAKEIIRLRRPALIKEGIGGGIIESTVDGKVVSRFYGTKETKYLKGEVEGVKYLQKKPTTKILKDIAEPTKIKGGAEGIQYSKFERNIYNPLKELGKKEELFIGISGSKKLGTIELGGKDLGIFKVAGKDFNLYKGASISKKIAPLKRKLEVGKGKLLIEKGQPEWIVTDKTFTKTKGVTGGGKKSSPKYLEQLYAKQEQTTVNLVSDLTKTKAKPLPKPIPKPSPTSTPTLVVDTTETVPSAYAGTGLYERTGVDIPAVKLEPITRVSLGDNIFGGSFTDTSSDFDTPSLLTRDVQKVWGTGISDTIQDVRLQTKLQTRQKVKDISILSPIAKGKEIQILQTKQLQRQRLKQQLKLLQKQQQRQQIVRQPLISTQPTTKPQTPKVTKIPIRPFKPESGSELNRKDILKSGLGKIKVFGRRYGKDILLEEVRTKKEATLKLRKFLVGGLGASGFAERRGKKIKLNLGRGFRPSKLEAKRVVQKKGSRFGSGRETKEAQSQRKKNKRTWRY